MKKHKRLLAGLLAVSMVIGTGSCSGSRNTDGDDSAATTTAISTNAATTDPNAALDTQINYDEMANIEEVDSANEEGTGPAYTPGQKAGLVKALCYYDITADQPEISEIFAERYGGTVETQICGSMEYFEKLGMLIAAGTAPDLVRYDWAAYPDGVSKNRYTALDEWLDMDSPLWSDIKSVIESFEYLGQHYYYPQNVMPNFAMIYNRANIEEANLEDPMDLYFAGEWTWDKWEEMLYTWAAMDEENLPFTGGSWSSMMFINTTGTQIIDVTEDDIVNNLRDKNVSRTMEWLEKLKREGLVGEGYIHPEEAFVDGKLLFLAMGFTWGFESAQKCLFAKNLDGEIAAVPFPRDPQADKYYLAADTLGFMVPAGAQNIQGGVQWILSSRIYETDPEVIEETRAEMMYDGPVYYAKCPECKYDCDATGHKDSPTCPECNAERRTKFKPVYSEEQFQVYDDMINPEKFGLVFDCTVGFNTDFQNIFVNSPETLLDGPLYGEMSFTTELETQYNVIEAYLNEYRALIKAGQ